MEAPAGPEPVDIDTRLKRIEESLEVLHSNQAKIIETLGSVMETVGALGETVGALGETVGALGETVGSLAEKVATKEDLAGLATKEDIAGLATKDEVQKLRGDVPKIASDDLMDSLRRKGMQVPGAR